MDQKANAWSCSVVAVVEAIEEAERLCLDSMADKKEFQKERQNC